MKKVLYLMLLLITTLSYSQNINLTESQALSKYKQSNVRKELGYKIGDFNYKELCETYKSITKFWGWNYDFSKMKIFNSFKNKSTFLKKIKENKKMYDEIDRSAAQTFPYTPLKEKDFGIK